MCGAVWSMECGSINKYSKIVFNYRILSLGGVCVCVRCVFVRVCQCQCPFVFSAVMACGKKLFLSLLVLVQELFLSTSHHCSG